jgi:putative addiction module CopG family antidote
MEVHLTPDQEAFIREAIETGRFRCPEDAVAEALLLWEERERTRAEILAAVETAEASLARGEGRAITPESMQQLADEVKQRGRTRLLEILPQAECGTEALQTRQQ